MKMKKVTYLIDDKKGFAKTLKQEDLRAMNGFRVYYTLEENHNGLFYALEDELGHKMNLDNLDGYEKMYINECFKCFTNNQPISKKYKDFIEVLDKPRNIEFSYNKRYLIFKEYAKQNNIIDSSLEYIKFIDKYKTEFELTHDKFVLSNQEEFDKFLMDKLAIKNLNNVEFNIKNTNFYKFIREELDRIIESYSNPAEYNLDNIDENLLDIMTEDLISDDYFNKIIDDYLQETVQFYANTNTEEESLTN